MENTRRSRLSSSTTSRCPSPAIQTQLDNYQLRQTALAQQSQALNQMQSAGSISADAAHPIYRNTALLATWLQDAIAELFSN